MRFENVQVKGLAGNEICQGAEMLYYQMILSGRQMSVGFSVKEPGNFQIIKNLSGYGARPNTAVAFLLTARQ